MGEYSLANQLRPRSKTRRMVNATRVVPMRAPSMAAMTARQLRAWRAMKERVWSVLREFEGQ